MVSSLSSAASVFARVDARKLERKQKNRRSGNACYAGYTGYVIAFVRSCGVTTRAFARIFREFDVWAQVKLLFCSLMKFVFAGSFDYSWRLWDLEQLKEVLHQVKYFYSSLFQLTQKTLR